MSATGTALSSYGRGSRRIGVAPRPATIRDGSSEPAMLEDLRRVNAAMIEAVSAGEGLRRVEELATEATGGRVAIVVPRLAATRAAESGDDSLATDPDSILGQWVTQRIRGRPAAVPELVLAEVPIRFQDDVVGVVALLSGDGEPRPVVSEFLHIAAGAAVMELAIEDARQETEQRLRGSFLEELRSSRGLDGPEIVRRAARFGCDLSRGAVIVCAELTTDRPRLIVTTISAEHPGALAQQLEGFGSNARPRVYAALPATVGDGSPEATLASARRLASRLERHAIVGVSSFHADPAELDCAVQEAELVLEVLQHAGAPIGDEIGGGTYKLLFRMLASHPEEVRSFYELTIGPLNRYDDQYRTDLLHTLQAYLDANCNMNATAAAIFAHRHTVAYRLERVHELTGLDPMQSEHRERLGLGLKIHRILAPKSSPVNRLGRD